MANLFGFGTYGGVLGHYLKFHIEANTDFNWLSCMAEFSEEENGVRILIELCKVQMFMAISSNIQDVYNYTSSSYFLRQEHAKEPDLTDFGIIEEQEDIYEDT